MQTKNPVIAAAMVGVLLAAATVHAITWSFDEPGQDYGWRARRSWFGGGEQISAFLAIEVNGGVLRVMLPTGWGGEAPSLELLSPPIHHDSGLFDRLTLRVRLLSDRPVVGALGLSWTNEHNLDNPGGYISGALSRELFASASRPVTYTTDWQEVQLTGLHYGPATLGSERHTVVWAGDLVDIRPQLILYDLLNVLNAPSGSGSALEALEIDWIRLTGLDEQSQGELPPPELAGTTAFGDLFAPPRFHGLGTTGLGGLLGGLGESVGALADLDGDGDPDLVALWHRAQRMPDDLPDAAGWMAARNDGTGKFELTASHLEFGGVEGQRSMPGLVLDAADLDGDGRAELVLGAGVYWVRLLRNDEDEGFVVDRVFDENVRPLLRDADGDGDVDLYLVEYVLTPDRMHSTDSHLWILRNHGAGLTEDRLLVDLDVAAGDWWPCSDPVQHLNGGATTGVLWCNLDAASAFRFSWLEPSGDQIHRHLSFSGNPVGLLRYVGDFDLDGDVDAVTCLSSRVDMHVGGRLGQGLSFLINDGDGILRTVEWRRDVTLPADVCFVDLNSDGVLDPVFMDRDTRHPAVVVYLGRPGGLPVQEGRYPLEGVGGAVLVGDVDGNGSQDLVVLENTRDASGGVHVLLNRMGDRVTAVMNHLAYRDADATGHRTAATLPTEIQLHPAYPNPFNPETVIPFALPQAAQSGRLRIYNVMGQPVRTLVEGALGVGAHRVRWDGLDERGMDVPSGVYFCRLSADGVNRGRKIVRLE